MFGYLARDVVLQELDIILDIMNELSCRPEADRNNAIAYARGKL
jgi:hypothetical protein